MDAYSRAIQINPYISEVWFDPGSLYKSCNNQISDAIDTYAPATLLSHSVLCCSSKRSHRQCTSRSPRSSTRSFHGIRKPYDAAAWSVWPPMLLQPGARPPSSAPTLGDRPVWRCSCHRSLLAAGALLPAPTEEDPRCLLSSTTATYPLVHHLRRSCADGCRSSTNASTRVDGTVYAS